VKYCSVDYRPPASWTSVFLVACHCIIYVCNLILKCGKINWCAYAIGALVVTLAMRLINCRFIIIIGVSWLSWISWCFVN